MIRFAILTWSIRIFEFFTRGLLCEKERGGYTCRHGIHPGANGGQVRECDGSRVS